MGCACVRAAAAAAAPDRGTLAGRSYLCNRTVILAGGGRERERENRASVRNFRERMQGERERECGQTTKGMGISTFRKKKGEKGALLV